jgi:hypothetical protein
MRKGDSGLEQCIDDFDISFNAGARRATLIILSRALFSSPNLRAPSQLSNALLMASEQNMLAG